jgi:hypothetical protein
MKKVLIALVTFFIGVLAFNLLDVGRAKTAYVPVCPVLKAVETLPTQYEYHSSGKPIDSKPFFNSFKADEGYGGWFIADDFRGMKEVWTILLSGDDEKSKNGKIGWSAIILTQNADYSANDDDDFHSIWIKTENNRLSFRTNKIRGIEYRFNGEFFKTGNDFTEDEKVLKGTLQKIVKGKVIAKFTADFAYNEPHCFH